MEFFEWDFSDFIEYLSSELFEYLLELSEYFTAFIISIYDGICSVGDNTLSELLPLFIADNLGSIFSSNFFFFAIGLLTVVFFIRLFCFIINLIK